MIPENDIISQPQHKYYHLHTDETNDDRITCKLSFFLRLLFVNPICGLGAFKAFFEARMTKIKILNPKLNPFHAKKLDQYGPYTDFYRGGL